MTVEYPTKMRLAKAAPRSFSTRLVVIFCLSCGLGLSCGVNSDSGVSQQLPGIGATGAPMPGNLHAAYLRARQSEAKSEHAFLPIKSTGPGLEARNAEQGLDVRLDRNGLHLRSFRSLRTPSISMRLTSQGCAASARPVSPIAPHASIERHRVEYRRQDITEWYVNGPLGLEHGFTLDRDPGCSDGKLAFTLALEGDEKATIVGRGARARVMVDNLQEPVLGHVLVYSDLFALDADGKLLPSSLLLSDRTVRLEVEARGARYPVTVDPMWTEQTRLSGSDAADGDAFGWSVAVSGDTAIIGAPKKQNGANREQGQAYVYFRSGTSWSEQAKLVASDGADNDHFGRSVAIDESTAVVGAYSKTVGTGIWQGQAYVYVRSGSRWSEQAKLVASDGETEDAFGTSVSISGDTIIIGADSKQVGGHLRQGQAYIYVRTGPSWSQQAKLVGSDSASFDYFGDSVAISLDTAIVGACGKSVGTNGGQGQAYVYVRSGTSWIEQAKLAGSDGAPHDCFGYSVALSRNTAVVGAHLKDVGANSAQGQAYVYVRSGTSWAEQAKLVASDGAAVDNFGFAVAVSGDTAVVGAAERQVRGNPQQGQGYVYTRAGAAWVEQAILDGSDGATGDQFGAAVAASGDTVVLGAPFVVLAGKEQGQAYVFIGTSAPNGTSCIMGIQCTSSFCVDGVCCDSLCGGGLSSDCQSCLGTQTGGSNGTCGTIKLSANYTCRSANAICDKPEICDGVNDNCPVDELYQLVDHHLCRAATFCSRDTYCNGSAAKCPPALCITPRF